jgi:hypothetical protein
MGLLTCLLAVPLHAQQPPPAAELPSVALPPDLDRACATTNVGGGPGMSAGWRRSSLTMDSSSREVDCRLEDETESFGRTPDQAVR